MAGPKISIDISQAKQDEAAAAAAVAAAAAAKGAGAKPSQAMSTAFHGSFIKATDNLQLKMQKHQEELEKTNNNIVDLKKIGARLTKLTDPTGALKITPCQDLTELMGWLNNAKLPPLNLDTGDLDAFLKDPHSVSVKILGMNVQNAIDKQKMDFELKNTESLALQQQFNVIMTMTTDGIEKDHRTVQSTVRNIKAG